MTPTFSKFLWRVESKSNRNCNSLSNNRTRFTQHIMHAAHTPETATEIWTGVDLWRCFWTECPGPNTHRRRRRDWPRQLRRVGGVYWAYSLHRPTQNTVCTLKQESHAIAGKPCTCNAAVNFDRYRVWGSCLFRLIIFNSILAVDATASTCTC